MSDTKNRKVKNLVWRWFRRIRDRAWQDVEPTAELALEHLEDELVALLVTGVAAGLFAHMADALAWLKERADDLNKD